MSTQKRTMMFGNHGVTRHHFGMSRERVFSLRVFATCVGMFAIILVISIFTTFSSNQRTYEDSLYQQAEFAGHQMSMNIASYAQQTQQLSKSNNLIGLLRAQELQIPHEQWEHVVASDLLMSMGNLTIFQGVSIQNNQGQFLLGDDLLPTYNELAKNLEVSAMDFGPDLVATTMVEVDNQPVLVATAPIMDSQNCLGYLHLFFNQNFISLPRDMTDKLGMLFYQPTQDMIFSDHFIGLSEARQEVNSCKKLLENMNEALKTGRPVFSYWDPSGHRKLAGLHGNEDTKILTVVAVDYDEMIRTALPYTISQAALSLLLTILMMAMLNSYSKRLYQPFREMVERCDRMANGDDSARFEPQSDRELNRLADAFERYRNKVEQAAYFDPLLRIGNRVKALKDVDMLISESPKRDFSLFLIDIQDFSKYNEIFSFSVGDQLLVRFSAGLKEIFHGRIYRINGDVFLGVVLDGRTDEEISTIAQQLLLRKVALEDVELELRYSMGVSHYPQDGIQASELLENAQRALSKAKEDHTLPMVVYSEEITQLLRYEDYVTALLHRRIEDQSLEFWYQPIFSVNEQRFVSAELLMRLQDDGGNYVRPDQVIAIIEKKSQVEVISDYVLRCACNTVKQLPADFQNLKINLSVQQLIQPNFADKALHVIRALGVRPNQIGMEVTETMLIQSFDSATSTLQHLKDEGVQIALDDFGTGYSSISYLARLPLDVLKLDMYLVRQVTQSTEQMELIRAVVQLARSRKMTVVAEGVGDQETLDKVVDCGADYIQGYFYAKPMPEDEFIRFIYTNASEYKPIEQPEQG